MEENNTIDNERITPISIKESNEELNMEPVKEPKLMIPVHILAICGDQSTPVDMRLSCSQVAFVTPEQYKIINLRLNDMANTINGFINENSKEG